MKRSEVAPYVMPAGLLIAFVVIILVVVSSCGSPAPKPAERDTGIDWLDTACTKQGHRIYWYPAGSYIAVIEDPACKSTP